MSNKLGFHLVTHLSVAPACLCIMYTYTICKTNFFVAFLLFIKW